VGSAEVLDQGLAGLVLKLLEAGGLDVEWMALGLADQQAGLRFAHPEEDFTHGVSLASQSHL
jgi:hypothetical protein